MCDMPMDKIDVTCPYCWWRGKRHPYTWAARPCPRCGEPVSGEWIFKTAAIPTSEKQAKTAVENRVAALAQKGGKG